MIPELELLEKQHHSIRIPHQIDVPVSDRVLRLVDSPEFQRLSHISQLGLVSRVYPGAKHTRFEHSLGVYRNALLFLRRLLHFSEFQAQVSPEQVESLVVAALLHDLGHWPYCHLMEDMELACIPKHESLAIQRICHTEIRDIIEKYWSCNLELVGRLIQNKPSNQSEKLLCSILSGPIDIDKMDYLYRDSLHCGVPYGMNFDAPRLIQTICLNQEKDGIAIHPKGKTAAEMMVFARYVMFSEVYWHHTVRSASAMLQRLCFQAMHNGDSDAEQIQNQICHNSLDSNFSTFLEPLIPNAADSILFQALFGRQRSLYKRVKDFNANENPELFKAIAHQRYSKIQDFNFELADRLSSVTRQKIENDDLLIDAPPMGLEVQFKVEINDGIQSSRLEDESPIVSALATKQFDSHVKKIRVFVHPKWSGTIQPADVEASLFATAKCLA